MSVHDTDFYTWTQEQVALLRAGRVFELDVDNLIEEIEDMGRSERRELVSRLSVLLAHLLKWRYQSDHQSNSWRFTIETQRKNVNKLLRQNPGLKPIMEESVVDAYDDARLLAVKETHLGPSTFPENCPWSLGQIMDDKFWPG
ncbi:conserved hypothetical protein [Gammaproteobacteria bacterium]